MIRSSKHVYNGPLKAAILDWSGTTVDKYVIAPAEVFCKVFDKFGVPISMQEARQPMGLRKDLHIKAITKIPSVKQRWIKKYNYAPTDKDVNAMFTDFVPMQMSVLDKYSTLLPGAANAVNYLKNSLKLKIGVSTGFNRQMVDVLLKNAEKQGFVPDSAVAADDIDNGVRPSPFMIYKNLEMLNIYPIQSVVKVDDTVGGIGEGLSAGCWTVGVARYSNYMNIDSLEHELTLDDTQIKLRLEKSRKILKDTGAHYVINEISDLPCVVKNINMRLKNGEQPSRRTPYQLERFAEGWH